jgi:hypothetical protein
LTCSIDKFLSQSAKKSLAKRGHLLFYVHGSDHSMEIAMRRTTLVTVTFALVAAVLWHLPRAAPRAAETAVSAELIAFDQYREFRLRNLAQQQERLAQRLAAPDLPAAEKESLERQKAYYDRLAAMPEAERDRLFRARFDRIDANRDGKLDQDERAAWRSRQSEHYRQLAAHRAGAGETR